MDLIKVVSQMRWYCVYRNFLTSICLVMLTYFFYQHVLQLPCSMHPKIINIPYLPTDPITADHTCEVLNVMKVILCKC